MHRVLSMSLDAAIAALALVPLFLILNRRLFHDLRRTAYCLFFAVYLCAMFAVAGLPDIRYIRFDPRFNFVPFAYMFSDHTNSLLNVLLFVPMGLSLPILWKHFSPAWRTVLFGLCTSLLIEVLQIFTYRATDINDLMTNTLGTLAGWSLGALILQRFSNLTPGENTGEILPVCGTAFAVMFFIQPFLAGWLHC